MKRVLLSIFVLVVLVLFSVFHTPLNVSSKAVIKSVVIISSLTTASFTLFS